MFLIVLLFLLFPYFCWGDQILRETWSLDDGSVFLYRIYDESSLGEVSFFSDSDMPWIPGVVILESDSFQAGSFQPSGIWKFSILEAPVQDRVLRMNHGLVTDRSKSSLTHPAAAFYSSFGGAGMIQSREDLLQYAIWQEFQVLPYTPVTLGFSQTHLETVREPGTSWFVEPEIPGNDFYYAIADIRTELPSSRIHILSALSLSELLSPGYSIMPVYTGFYGLHDLTLRYWYNSGHWINRNLEKPEWVHYGDLSLHLNFNSPYRFDSDAYWGWNQIDQDRGVSCSIIRETGFSKGTVGYTLSESISGDEREFLQVPEVSVTTKVRLWLFRSEGSLRFSSDRMMGWQCSAQVIRYHGAVMTSSLKTSCKAEPGTLGINPVLEESLKMGNWTFKTSAGYSFDIQTKKDSVSNPFELRCQVEWHQR